MGVDGKEKDLGSRIQLGAGSNKDLITGMQFLQGIVSQYRTHRSLWNVFGYVLQDGRFTIDGIAHL